MKSIALLRKVHFIVTKNTEKRNGKNRAESAPVPMAKWQKEFGQNKIKQEGSICNRKIQ